MNGEMLKVRRLSYEMSTISARSSQLCTTNPKQHQREPAHARPGTLAAKCYESEPFSRDQVIARRAREFVRYDPCAELRRGYPQAQIKNTRSAIVTQKQQFNG